MSSTSFHNPMKTMTFYTRRLGKQTDRSKAKKSIILFKVSSVEVQYSRHLVNYIVLGERVQLVSERFPSGIYIIVISIHIEETDQ